MLVMSYRTAGAWAKTVVPGQNNDVGGGGANQPDNALAEIQRSLSDCFRCSNLIVLTGLGTSLHVNVEQSPPAGDVRKAISGKKTAPTMSDLWDAVQKASGDGFNAVLKWSRFPIESHGNIEALLSYCKVAEGFVQETDGRLAGITALRKKGYSEREITEKTGLSFKYVQDILMLVDKGEERLIVAVERKIIPLYAALMIVDAGDDDKNVQAALQDAYESGQLRGRQLMEARALIQRRHLLGRSMARGTHRKSTGVSSTSLVRAYQKEVQRQQMLVRKASFAQQRLLFVVGALRELYSDENFVNLLRAERLDTLPKYLAERITTRV